MKRIIVACPKTSHDERVYIAINGLGDVDHLLDVCCALATITVEDIDSK